ncbi:hypothetical protein PCASD_26533 [Puccinia coronata f. sp. avenae]|uniref:Uncharacterized protein n=1 Tax=Puccinia coronata f. sp. avenae TaxID=200324 RepID=A0A2N5RYD3_9BASI|nr:hypothetical protein PCASD_26533 [Puccinia coronata f. sp. avenae]
MPFLYKLLFAKAMEKGMEDLETQNNDADDETPEDDGGLADLPIIDEATPVTSSTSSLDEAIVPKDPVWLTQRNVSEYDGYALAKSKDPLVRKRLRAETIARTTCAMVAYAANRRHNASQLSNSLMFLAAGVTKRVREYLNHIGLCSSRKTTHAALQSLGKEAEINIKSKFKTENSPILPPSICYDNLDFQQNVHMASVGHASMMFHGT